MVLAAYDPITDKYLLLDSDGSSGWGVSQGGYKWVKISVSDKGIETVDGRDVGIYFYYIYGKK